MSRSRRAMQASGAFAASAEINTPTKRRPIGSRAAARPL
jgi:hypothetical protein